MDKVLTIGMVLVAFDKMTQVVNQVVVILRGSLMNFRNASRKPLRGLLRSELPCVP